MFNVPFFLLNVFTLPQSRTYNPNTYGPDACTDHKTKQILKGEPPWIYVQHNVRALAVTAQDRTQTKDKHPNPGFELKFPTPPGIEPGPPGWKAGTLPPTPRRWMKLVNEPPWICVQHNVRTLAEDSTGQNTDKGQTPKPRIWIKIPDPAGNRTRAAGLECRDSTAHATATDEVSQCT